LRELFSTYFSVALTTVFSLL